MELKQASHHAKPTILALGDPFRALLAMFFKLFLGERNLAMRTQFGQYAVLLCIPMFEAKILALRDEDRVLGFFAESARSSTLLLFW